MAFYEYSKLKWNAFLLLSILVKWKNNSLSMFLLLYVFTAKRVNIVMQ